MSSSPQRAVLLAATMLTLSATISSRALSAQGGASPVAPGNPVTETIASFGFYGSWLRAAFDSIPASKYNFKPTAVQQDVGFIAQHLENANYQLCETISGVKHARTAKDSVADSVKARWPKDTLTARLNASLQFCRNAFTKVNDGNLAELLTVGAPGETRTAPRMRFLMLLITDLAEHYSQIASYMRQIGLIPPSALPAPKP